MGPNESSQQSVQGRILKSRFLPFLGLLVGKDSTKVPTAHGYPRRLLYRNPPMPGCRGGPSIRIRKRVSRYRQRGCHRNLHSYPEAHPSGGLVWNLESDWSHDLFRSGGIWGD